MMLVIRNILSRVVNVPKPVLGRWGTEYDVNQLNTRIDLANEDHCGPCGSYVLNKHNEKRLKENSNKKVLIVDDNSNKKQLSYEEFVKWSIMRSRQ